MHADKWINDATDYYRAMSKDRVAKHNTHMVLGTKQSTLTPHLVHNPHLTRQQKKHQALRWNLTCLQRELRQKESSLEGDISFTAVSLRKKNRNYIGEIFPGIGRAKCNMLLRAGIRTAKELLDYDEDHPAVKQSWKDTVSNYYSNLTREVAGLKSRVEALQDEVDIEIAIDPLVAGEAPATQDEQEPHVSTEPDASTEVFKLLPFSSLTDPNMHNCRTISKASINRIVMTDFQHRNPMQLAKMRSICSSVWKIDWHYKLPKKIKVCLRKGKSFAPFKSAMTVQNEDALTIFWKFYPGAESFETAREDLSLLNRRNQLLGNETLVAYVDNCCQVRPKLKSIIPTLRYVLLDCFHWMKRWNDIMFDLNSEKTTMFRSLMRRALFLIENSEIARVKYVLASTNRRPTTKQIMKAAKATIPPAKMLEPRVMSVLHTLMKKDNDVDLARTTGNPDDPKESRFFKRGAITLNTIVNQMEHVRKGCLSDPPASCVKIHRFNPRTKKTYAARSTGTNENDNRGLNRLLDTPSVGLTRADRLIHNYYEKSNDNKRINRLGESPEQTTRIEQLQMLHGLAKSCGFASDDIPLPASFPHSLKGLDEKIGFDCARPSVFDHPSDMAEDESHEASMSDFLQDITFEEDDDMLLDRGQFGDITEASLSEEKEDDELEPNDIFAFDKDVDLSLLLPKIIDSESTHATFIRKSMETPWVPFRHPSESTQFTELDKAEHALFDSMTDDYDRNQRRLDSGKGYKQFEKAWDLHVANLFKAKLEGNNEVLVINGNHTCSYKSTTTILHVTRSY